MIGKCIEKREETAYDSVAETGVASPDFLVNELAEWLRIIKSNKNGEEAVKR